MRADGERALGYAFVVAQSMLIGLVFVPRGRARRTAALRVATGAAIGAGSVVATAGAFRLGPALTPMPVPRDGGQLRTGGAYSVVRHPMYTGVMALTVARAIRSGGRVPPAAAAALCGLLAVKARWEERMLRTRYPDYDEYARRTPRFVPRFRA